MRKLTYEEISQTRRPPDSISPESRLPLVILAENIRSLYNVGSIFRTSDGALIEQLLLSGFTPTPPRKEIEKTALGATKSVPWKYVRDPLAELAALRARGYNIACLEQTDTSLHYTQITLSHFPLCLVVGNEVTGVSQNVLSAADFAIDIPMHGSKHSLNVAVAYGIALFELSRIWRSSPGH